MTGTGTLALALLLPKTTATLSRGRNVRLGLYLLTIASVIFRGELALLLGCYCLWLLLKPQTFEVKVALLRKTLLPAILPGALLALALTVTIDTHLWCSPKWLWPELASFMSNLFPTDGKGGASDWGTQPFHWYFTAALPRLLMIQVLPMSFTILSAARHDVRVLDNLIPSTLYIVLYSFLPHKETRFIFPVIPSLTLVAALICTRLTINMHKSAVNKFLLYLTVVGTILMALVSHTVLLPLSALNYPGGQALKTLHQFYGNNWQDIADDHGAEIHVHLTNLALQTGVTRFLEQPAALNMSGEVIVRPSIVDPTRGDNSFKPLTLPGDAYHPALTIQPSPRSTATAKAIDHLVPHWIYDKTSDEGRLLEPVFWDQFSFVIVEEPHLAIGAWDVIDTIQALGRPLLLRPLSPCPMRYGAVKDEHSDENQDSEALLHAMYPSIVAEPLADVYNLLHDIFRCGRWSPIALGYWIEVPLQTRLYILERSSTSTSPNERAAKGAAKAKSVEDEALGLPHEAADNQMPLDFDQLGPLVVNKDGTLSRLDNWARMNKQERKKTVDYLNKRNMIRLEAAPI